MLEDFKTETVQPLATLIIPGTVAIAPYAVLAVQHNAFVGNLFEHHDVTFAGLILFTAVAVGFILEDIGAQVEAKIIDRTHSDAAEAERVWWLYLRTAFPCEPIGQRYLQTILLRFKFELSFGTSTVLALPGVFLLKVVDALPSWRVVGGIMALLVALCVYSLFEAVQSSRLLAKIRDHLTKGVIVANGPAGSHGDSASGV
jgi:hypothetical protein